MTRWQLEPILESYSLVIGLGGALLLLLLLRPLFPSATSARQRVLLGLRILLIGLVMLALLRPTLVEIETRHQKSTLIVLLDRSRSMQVADMAGRTTRWEALRKTINQALPDVTAMGEKLEVKVYAFDSAAEALELTAGTVDLPQVPTGDQSDIGSSLYDVIRAESGHRLAGVVLLSDGAQRAIAPRVNLDQPARELARLDTPLLGVVFGKPRDQSQSRDVAVENLPDQYMIFVKSELAIRATVRMEGLANVSVPVSLVIQSPDGTEQTLGPIPVRQGSNGQPRDVNFSYTPDVAGQYTLTLAAEEQAGELITENNRLSSYLTVLDGGLRVLMLEGNVGWPEHKFIRRSIDESPDIELDFHWAHNRLRDQTLDIEALMAERPYDVLILSDIDSLVIGEENCARLANMVSEGKGLIMLGGRHSFGAGGYQQTELAKVLPIKMGRLQRQRIDEPMRPDLHRSDELTMIPTTDHFITRLANRGSNLATWQSLPKLKGANRFEKVSDRAMVLATTLDGMPLLVAGEYGLGRVLAMAADSTYLWPRYDRQLEHKRFWRQTILWLARKEDAIRRDVWIDLDQRRFPLGARAAFTLGARDATGDEIANATFEVELDFPDGAQRKLSVARESEQWLGRTGPLDQPGEYVLRVVASQLGKEIGRASRPFLVQATDLELSDPAANPNQMASLTQITAEAGGKTLAAEQLPDLLKSIADNPPETQVEYESKQQLADKPEGAWKYFLCFVGVISTEWWLRKKWGMV